MGKSKIFKEDVERVFGHKPKCGKRRIGFNMAAIQFGACITLAEKALKEPLKDLEETELQSTLKLAFRFSTKQPYVREFPKATRHMLDKCARKVKKRYAQLLDPTDPSPS